MSKLRPFYSLCFSLHTYFFSKSQRTGKILASLITLVEIAKQFQFTLQIVKTHGNIYFILQAIRRQDKAEETTRLFGKWISIPQQNSQWRE